MRREFERTHPDFLETVAREAFKFGRTLGQLGLRGKYHRPVFSLAVPYPKEFTHLTTPKISPLTVPRWWESSGTLVPRFVRLEYRDRFAPAGLLCIDKSSRPCDENFVIGVTGKTNFLKE